jgi:carboxy-cis,cis-muconate cyclase
MSEPPQLFAWSVDEQYKFTHLDTVNISNSPAKTSQALF